MRKARKISASSADFVLPQTAVAARRPNLRSSPARMALYHVLLLGGIFVFGESIGSGGVGVTARVLAFGLVIGGAALVPAPLRACPATAVPANATG